MDTYRRRQALLKSLGSNLFIGIEIAENCLSEVVKYCPPLMNWSALSLVCLRGDCHTLALLYLFFMFLLTEPLPSSLLNIRVPLVGVCRCWLINSSMTLVLRNILVSGWTLSCWFKIAGLSSCQGFPSSSNLVLKFLLQILPLHTSASEVSPPLVLVLWSNPLLPLCLVGRSRPSTSP